MQKTVNNFYEKTVNSFTQCKKTDFMNAVNRFEYTINMMYREQILLMQKQILSMQKNKFVHFEI